MTDIRDILFGDIADQTYTAVILPERAGILSGVDEAIKAAEEIGLQVTTSLPEGAELIPGTPIMRFSGYPVQIAQAEDRLMGCMAKASGIATSARTFVKAADGCFRIICGSWKKMPSEMKDMCRKAIVTGGAGIRLLDEPMIYLDKNYVAMMRDIKHCLEAVTQMPEIRDRKIVIQIKGRESSIDAEAAAAEFYGADVIYLDTGRITDFKELEKCIPYMKKVPIIAFGGNVNLSDIGALKKCRVDIVGIGKRLLTRHCLT